MSLMISTNLSSARSCGTGRRAALGSGGVPVPRRCATPLLRGHRICAGSDDTGFFSPAFREALSSAMERDRAAAQDMYSSSYERGGGDYSRADAYTRRREEQGNAMADPLMQVLATALGQSRATLERLQVEEAEIEALIQRERKQVERLEWLLEKVQQDYSYFNTLQRRFEEEGRRSGDPRF